MSADHPTICAVRPPIPDRLRGAGLVMFILTLPGVLMPVAVALGLSPALGVSVANQPAFAMTPDMIPWLAPLALATFVSGFFVYFGHGLRVGLVAALGWAVGTAFVAPTLAVVAGLVAYAIWTGERRMERAAADWPCRRPSHGADENTSANHAEPPAQAAARRSCHPPLRLAELVRNAWYSAIRTGGRGGRRQGQASSGSAVVGRSSRAMPAGACLSRRRQLSSADRAARPTSAVMIATATLASVPRR